MNIRYIDSFSHKTLHDQYNAAFLATCSYAFGRIEYIVGRSSYRHTRTLLDLLPDLNYSVRFISVVGGNSRMAVLMRTFLSAFQNIRLLIFSRKSDLLIYNFNNFISLPIINFLNKILKRQIVIVCHSELSFIVNDCVHKNMIYNLRTKVLRQIFRDEKKSLAPDIRFCVLGESILENLKYHIPLQKMKHFISIDHPYIFSDRQMHMPVQQDKTGKKIRIGVIGTMAQEKGADILTAIARRINLLEQKNIDIVIVGKILCDTKQFEDVGIQLPPGNGKDFLDREVFNSLISELDYILYLYPMNSYRFTASGSIMDAINYGKPILSFENHFFSYLFRKYGKLGYLIRDENEMTELIENTLPGIADKEQLDFSNIRNSLAPKTIYKELIAQLHTND